MFGLWNFLLYSIWWPIQVGIVAIIAAVLFLLAVKIFGWERMRHFLLPILAVIGAGALLSRSRQAGWKDKVAADVKASEKLIERATDVRAETTKKLEEKPETLRNDDGFRRD